MSFHTYSFLCSCAIALLIVTISLNLCDKSLLSYWSFLIWISSCILRLNFLNIVSMGFLWYPLIWYALRSSSMIRCLNRKVIQFLRMVALVSFFDLGCRPRAFSSVVTGIRMMEVITFSILFHITLVNLQSKMMWYASSGILLHSGHGYEDLCHLL